MIRVLWVAMVVVVLAALPAAVLGVLVWIVSIGPWVVLQLAENAGKDL